MPSRYRPLPDQDTYAAVTRSFSDLVLKPGRRPAWAIALGITALFLLLFLVSVAVLLAVGVGIWGIDIPVAWGFAITNFVWWIGIGHAGTLISAILLLLRQPWRASINRFAEAMTLFAVTCAGLFPLMHLGRPWFFYWMIPYPNTMDLWPQFNSPLVWDLFAVFTYFTVSLLFWYMGLIPDLATLRDRASGPVSSLLFGLFALGWRGSARHWQVYDTAYLYLAGLATPLVVSVHSIVSLDFSVAVVPGWHSTIFPPYFVAGAIFSGFAMVLTLAIPLRAYYGLKAYVTERHLDVMAQLMLATGLFVAYGYVMENFMAWFGNDPYDKATALNRLIGDFAPIYWLVIACNVGVPQLLWKASIRQNALLLFLISLVVNLGMWSERYMIVVGSLHRDFLPAAWGRFVPTMWDWATLAGSLGLFFFLFTLFVRFFPVSSMVDIKQLIRRTGGSRS